MNVAALAVITPASNDSHRIDAGDVDFAVRRYCQRIGCTCSNTQGAVAWALRAPGHTLQAIREGRQRADQLRARQ